MFGEIIGKFSYMKKGESSPSKYHFSFQFDDGSIMTFQSSLYAFLTVATRDEIKLHRYAGNIGPSPNESNFSLDYFLQVLSNNEKKPIKSVLNLQGEISGLGNAYINDILFEANIHPKIKVSDLNENEKNTLYDSIIKIIKSAIELGGSSDELDLYGNFGKYIRVMTKNSSECNKCGNKILKENIFGSSSYYCPQCQKL
jgi:formamidopyrimidine-DNA glycosylase